MADFIKGSLSDETMILHQSEFWLNNSIVGRSFGVSFLAITLVVFVAFILGTVAIHIFILQSKIQWLLNQNGRKDTYRIWCIMSTTISDVEVIDSTFSVDHFGTILRSSVI